MLSLLEFATIVESDDWDSFTTIYDSEHLDMHHSIYTYSLNCEDHLTHYQRQFLVVEVLNGVTDTYRLVRPYNPYATNS